MGKQWSNAPVFYTLTQVKFNPIAQMEDYAPKLQDKLRRNGYPDYKPEQKIEVTINKLDSEEPNVSPQKMRRWSFTNPERTEGYILNNDSLVYHSTRYEIFDDFLEKAIKGLELTHDVIGLAYVERIGLRYLDAITPAEEESISDYLEPSVLGLSPNFTEGLKHGFSETAAEINGGTLITRTVITDGGLAMPPDLFPMPLNMPEKLNRSFGRTAILDTDYFVESRNSFNIDLVQSQLHESHTIIGNTFKSIISEHAIKAWE